MVCFTRSKEKVLVRRKRRLIRFGRDDIYASCELADRFVAFARSGDRLEDSVLLDEEKRALKGIQELTDGKTKEINDVYKHKEDEIKTI